MHFFRKDVSATLFHKPSSKEKRVPLIINTILTRNPFFVVKVGSEDSSSAGSLQDAALQGKLQVCTHKWHLGQEQDAYI
jgi:hypothetical protein